MTGNSTRGFTMFFAVLIAGLALTIGVVLFDLVVRELALSQTTAQSQAAFYAADTGAECALYWDSKCTLANCYCYGRNSSGSCISGTAFATSSTSQYPTSGLSCAGWDVAQYAQPPTPFAPPTAGWSAWSAQTSAPTTTTAFTLFMGSGGASLATTSCATVYVAKYQVAGVQHTVVTSHGFNTCAQTAPNRVERVLQTSY